MNLLDPSRRGVLGTLRLGTVFGTWATRPQVLSRMRRTAAWVGGRPGTGDRAKRSGLATRLREASQGPAYRWWVLAAVECGNFVVYMDGFIVTLALPAMARHFGVGIHEIKWVLVAYLAALTVTLLLADPGPMYVMFSGPTVNLLESAGGASLEWYQPIHETGSVFSYPWSLEQLQAAEGGIDLLTSSDPDGFATDSSTHTAEATWAGQQTTTSTSGTASNISWKVSTSVTEKAGIFGGIVGNQTFSYNGSKSVQHLNTSTTTLGQSTGIGIVKPGTFPNPGEYQYPIFPYIFGSTPLSGTVQTVPLSTTVQSLGVLRAAFTADPTNSTAGAWWQATYTLPDVAVAHSNRWNFQIYTPNAPMQNCIPLAVTIRNNDCASFNTPEPNIWTSEYYWMKGLLITPAGANGDGPQLTQAVAGVPLLLRTRVYNYSLANMPSGSKLSSAAQPVPRRVSAVSRSCVARPGVPQRISSLPPQRTPTSADEDRPASLVQTWPDVSAGQHECDWQMSRPGTRSKTMSLSVEPEHPA